MATAATGMSGLDAAVTDRPDLVVLDLGLPDVDGAQVLRMLRAVSDVPVIVTTARNEEPVMVAVLGDGADDYIVKPFGPAQLDARIKAVLRRFGTAGPEPALRVGGLLVEAAAREVTLDGAPLELTPREFDLLVYLARRAGQVISRRELLAEVWQQPLGGTDKTLDVHLVAEPAAAVDAQRLERTAGPVRVGQPGREVGEDLTPSPRRGSGAADGRRRGRPCGSSGDARPGVPCGWAPWTCPEGGSGRPLPSGPGRNPPR